MKMELFQDYFNKQKTKFSLFLCKLLLICSLFLVFSCDNFGTVSKFAQDCLDDTMLVMVYVAGANTLNREVIMDINSMEKGLFLAKQQGISNLKVVALVDKDISVGNETWTGSRLYEIQPYNTDLSSNKIHSKVIEKASNSLGTWRTGSDDEEDMGNIQTLKNFILWASETYPFYKKQSLILWNHGGGVYSDYKPQKNICTDLESGATSESLDNTLYIGEIKELLESLYSKENPLEFLGLDACFMGMYEIAYQFRNVAKYMSFSPATEWGGWNYEHIFSQKNTANSGKDFAINAVDGYKIAYDSLYPNTLTAIDLQYAQDLKNSIDKLSYTLGIEYNTDPTSLKENIEKVKQLSIFMHQKDDKKINSLLLHYPYYELGSLLRCFRNENPVLSNDLQIKFSISTASAAFEIQTVLEKMILKTWLGGDYGNAYRESKNLKEEALVFEKNIPYGISIFFSNKDNFSHQGFYTNKKAGEEGVLGYGCIEAANENDNDKIDTWYELQCALYRE